MSKRKRVQNVMIKPTHDCDMNCDYCFVSTLTEKYREQIMSLETINEVFRVLSNSAEEVHIIWHGGEPTMMGTQWYKDMLEISYLYSDRTKFTHSMQSNGLTLNEDWADLHKNYGIDIAVSYDGLYQDFRKKNTGKPVENNLIAFKDYVGRAGCLSVVTEDSYKGMIENYEYFKSIGVDASFNYGINPNPESTETFHEITTEDYVREYMKFFMHWIKDQDGFAERSCLTTLNQVLGLGSSTCSTSDCRHKWLNVNPDGTTAHCNRYFPEEWGMGNIKDVNHVDELYATEGYKGFCESSQLRLDNDCKDCSHLSYCNGGCNSMHLMNTGNMSVADKTYCERFKMEFLEVYKTLRKIDIHNGSFNTHFIKTMDLGVFTPKEVIDFLIDIGISKEVIKFEEDNLQDCVEFKLFRIFNPYNKEKNGGHTDIILENGRPPTYETMKKRYVRLLEIYQNNKEDINSIIQGEGLVCGTN